MSASKFGLIQKTASMLNLKTTVQDINEEGLLGVASNPYYAAGQIFVAQSLASLMARAVYTPGIFEVMQLLIVPDKKDDQSKFVWQITPPMFDGTLQYGTLFARFTQDLVHAGLPLGLYRKLELEQRHLDTEGYVWTNPPKETELRESDLIYVLGNKAFGAWVHEQGLLCFSGNNTLQMTEV